MGSDDENPPLVCVVTGGSRGVGKGIALGLAEAGAVIYVTSRTVEPGSSPLPGTLAETVAEIEERGGRGIAVRCDHAHDDDVRALVERVGADHGHLDVLVNNAFALPDGPLFNTPFWEQPISFWDTMHTVGLRSHYVATALLAPLLLKAKHGLVVNVSSFGAATYQINVAYGVAKAAVDRLTADMAKDFEPHGVSCVSLWPGVVRTERIMAMGDALPWSLEGSESPVFSGRVVAALALDEDRTKHNGKAVWARELAKQYGVTDDADPGETT